MNKRLRLPLALSLALGSSSAFALGLGQIEVKSALNQPLSAEIPVLSSSAGETDALAVRLAPPEALARVGLPEPSGVAANLEFAVDTNSAGQTVIRVSTPDEVTEPFVSFLLEVDWGKGKMLREYTVLLDPPTMAPIRSAPVAAPVSAPEFEPLPEVAPATETTPTPEPEPAAVFEPVPEPEAAEAPPPPEMAAPAAEPIAEPQPEPEPVAEPQPEPEPAAEAPIPEPEPSASPEPSPARVDTYGPVQTGDTLWSIATYARGEDTGISMNQMMLALLHANPDAFIDQNINKLKRGAVLRIPAREEAMLIAAADAAAQVREQMQAWRASQPASMQPAEPEPRDSTSPRSAAGPQPSADSRLELVPPRGAGEASSAQSGASVDGQGRELRAELARSQEQVNTLSAENVDLKSRVSELEKIQQDSQKLIALKDSELAAAQQRLADAQAASEAAPAGSVASDAAASPEPADTLASAATEAPTEPGTEPLPTDATGEVSSAAADAAGTEAATVAETAPAEAVSDQSPAADAVAGVAAAPWYKNYWVLGGGGLVLVGLLALLFGRRKPAPASSSGSTNYSGLIPAAATDSADAEAELDREAELVDAIVRDPGDLNRHLDLVRHHYENSDEAAFEQAAEAMHAHVRGSDNLAWKQVVAMGQEIAPEHPLFATPAPAPAAKPAPAFVPPPVAETPKPKPAAPIATAAAVDWSAAVPAPTAPVPADSATTQQLRIDDVKAAAPAPDLTPIFDLPEIEPLPEFDVSLTEPVLEAPGPAFVDADAASTKLELARAYLDMGDVDGARGMLEEVVGEGNPGQRAEAKRLLDEIR